MVQLPDTATRHKRRNATRRRLDGARVDEEIRQSLLLHPARRAILEMVRQRPGINTNQLRYALEIDLKLLDFHLGRMQDAGLVLRLRGARGREVLFFAPEDRVLWENPRTRILFGREPARLVGLFVAAHPGAHTNDVAGELGISGITVRQHLRTLQKHKLVVGVKVGRDVEYHPLTELRDWAAKLGPRFASR